MFFYLLTCTYPHNVHSKFHLYSCINFSLICQSSFSRILNDTSGLSFVPNSHCILDFKYSNTSTRAWFNSCLPFSTGPHFCACMNLAYSFCKMDCFGCNFSRQSCRHLLLTRIVIIASNQQSDSELDQ